MEEKKKKSGLCIAALVIGIVSIFWVPGTLLGLAAVIMGIIGLAKHKSPKGCAVWAIILGGFTTIVKNIANVVVAILIITGAIGLPFLAIGANSIANAVNSAYDYDYDYDNDYDYDYDNDYDFDYDYDYDYDWSAYDWSDDYSNDTIINADGYDLTTDEFYSDFYDNAAANGKDLTVTQNIGGVLFTMPDTFTYEYGNESYMCISDDFGQYEFPTYVYSMGGSDEETFYQALMNLTGSEAISGEVYYWNDEWDYATAEGYNEYNEYTYWVFAFSEENDIAVCLLARPDSGTFDTSCYTAEYLIDEMTYVGMY